MWNMTILLHKEKTIYTNTLIVGNDNTNKGYKNLSYSIFISIFLQKHLKQQQYSEYNYKCWECTGKVKKMCQK